MWYHILIMKGFEQFPLIYGSIIYLLLYVVVTFFIFFSKDVFWLTGALIFGPVLSTFLICVAEAINAVILFHIARRFGRTYIEDKISDKYKHLDEKLARISFFWIFIFRATPLVPYRFLDLGAGLTKIKFRKYFAAVILGSPVKTFWIQYILYGVGKSIFYDPGALVGYFLNNRGLFIFSLAYILLIPLAIMKIKFKE